MPILFALVARGSSVLAKHAECTGNFVEVCTVVLTKIPPGNSKLTYTHGNFLIHYISADRIHYVCVTNDDFERSKAFAFLTEVKRKFEMQYGHRAQTALPYSMNSEFSKVMQSLLTFYSTSDSAIQRTQSQVDELRDIMVRNIEAMTTRGERLELLVERAGDLEANSVRFQSTSQRIRRNFLMQNLKLTILIVVLVLVVLYFTISAACGGLDWPCTRKSAPAS